MRKCAQKCLLNKTNCGQTDCRLWIEYPEDHNCTLIAVEKHGSMTLSEIAQRHHISVVRVKQILDQTLAKIKKVISRADY